MKRTPAGSRKRTPSTVKPRARRVDLESLSSLGPASGQWLASVGIDTVAELKRVGAAEAFGRVRFRIGRAATRNLLYALEAALRDVHWTAITPADKDRLCKAAGIAPPKRPG